jgi:ADP-ribosylglycohydrolase
MEGRATLLAGAGEAGCMRLSRENMQWALKFHFLKTGALMHRYLSLLTIPAVVGLVASLVAQTDGSQFREISMEALRDKVQGGWAGQMIGVSFGAPTEFHYREQIIPEDKLPHWEPGKVDNSLNQDDLYVDMTFAKVLEDKGLDATTEDFGAMFKDAKYALWHANLAARRALKRGVPATLAGTPKYNAHANDIDFQIESDFIGLISPGLARFSNDLCYRAGRVMNHGDGIYGGMFISAMYAAGFFENDPRRIVEYGLAAIPDKSPYAQVVADMLRWSKEYPKDWIKVWNLVEAKWNKREPCPEGALKPFNIDAKLNGAYVVIGLLYGGSDFHKTLTIATRCGQDSDCNPASALGVLGVIKGYKAIPDDLKGGIDGIADKSLTTRTILSARSWTPREAGSRGGNAQRRAPGREELGPQNAKPDGPETRFVGLLRLPCRACGRNRFTLDMERLLGSSALGMEKSRAAHL